MQYVLPSNVAPIGYESITVDSTAGGKSLTAATYTVSIDSNTGLKKKASRALISVETQSVRWNVSPGVTVTDTTNGHLAAALDSIWLTSTTQIENFRAIRATGSDGTIRVTYFL